MVKALNFFLLSFGIVKIKIESKTGPLELSYDLDFRIVRVT